jgi:PurA ssDNA and RNA-binding protein
MSSYEHSSYFRPRLPGSPWHQSPSRPHPKFVEATLKLEQVQIERKTFVFLLKENPRGRFLRVIEEGGNRSSSVIIPSAGLREFKKLLDEMLKSANELPPSNPS